MSRWGEKRLESSIPLDPKCDACSALIYYRADKRDIINFPDMLYIPNGRGKYEMSSFLERHPHVKADIVDD